MSANLLLERFFPLLEEVERVTVDVIGTDDDRPAKMAVAMPRTQYPVIFQ